MDIIIIDIRIKTSRDHIQMIDDSAMLSNQGDEISKSGEFSDGGICFSKVRLFIACNH